jgi:hypothetical protein
MLIKMSINPNYKHSELTEQIIGVFYAWPVVELRPKASDSPIGARNPS